MAEEQKPVAPVTDAAPAVEPAAATTEPAVETVAEDKAVVEDKPAESAAKAEEAKPIEEGHLEHKGKGASFPNNFLFQKNLFWFGSDALDTKSLSSYVKGQKADAGHHNASWASHTGKGLLFYGDKSAPSGIINLSDASEPTVDGANKFHFTSKGHKHTFKAPSAADRDNWIAQLKLKIEEAKEVGATITETEAYKKAIESFKPAPPVKKEVKKEEKKEEVKAEEPAEPAKEEVKEEAAKEVTKEEPASEPKKSEDAPKERRSASKKRASIIGFLGGKKDKKEEVATEPTPETPATKEPVVPEAEPAKAVEPAAPAAEETVAAPAPAEEKPAPSKRNSIFNKFDSFSLGKKKSPEPAAPAVPAKEEPASETAPVIPPVAATTPLAVEVSSPATVPTETKDATPATNGESKPKNEKRKSSIPFLGSKKEKAVASDEEGEKSPGAFSKLRATIRGRGKPSGEKPAEKKEAEKKETETKTEEPVVAKEEEPVNKPEPVAAPVPAVTAAA